MADEQWLTEKHYLVCPKGGMFKQMKVTSQSLVRYSGQLAATTRDTMKESTFICLGGTAFVAGAVAGLVCAALCVPGPGWVMAAILGAALLLAVGAGYLKCKAAAASRVWIDYAPNMLIEGANGLVVGRSKLLCPPEGATVEIKETFWEAMMSTTLNNLGHLANFAFGFLAGRGFGGMAGTAFKTAGAQGFRAAARGFGAEFMTVARTEMAAMFNPLTLGGKMSWMCRALRGFGMYGAYKGQHDIWSDPNRSVLDKMLASGQELVLSIFAAKGATLVCFPAGTKVHTELGLVNIELLKPGMEVWTMNEGSGERELKQIVGIHRRTTLAMMVVELESGEVFEVTPEHRFFQDNDWKEIQHIAVLQELELRSGERMRVKNIGMVAKSATVYNFDVEGNENYFVTAAGVLVHNGYNYDAQDPAAIRTRLDNKGLTDVDVSPNGNPDFSNSSHLYPDRGKAIVEIDNTGKRSGSGGDFEQANQASGFDETPDGYTWHHMDDYDPNTGKSTMQLVETDAHNASKPHYGSVRQYEQDKGVKYK